VKIYNRSILLSHSEKNFPNIPAKVKITFGLDVLNSGYNKLSQLKRTLSSVECL